MKWPCGIASLGLGNRTVRRNKKDRARLWGPGSLSIQALAWFGQTSPGRAPGRSRKRNVQPGLRGTAWPLNSVDGGHLMSILLSGCCNDSHHLGQEIKGPLKKGEHQLVRAGQFPSSSSY